MRVEGSNKPKRFLAILIISLFLMKKREGENKKASPTMDETFDKIDALFSSFVEVLNTTDNSSNKLILIRTITDYLAFRAIYIAKF